MFAERFFSLCPLAGSDRHFTGTSLAELDEYMVQTSLAKPRNRLAALARRTKSLDGIACRFNTLIVGNRCGEGGQWHQQPYVLLEGALDRSLRRIAAGEQSFRLLARHNDADVLLTGAQAARCIELTRRGKILCMAIRPTTAAAQAALCGIRTSGMRGLSVGVNATRVMWGEMDGERILVIAKGKLTEISVTPQGACLGAELLL